MAIEYRRAYHRNRRRLWTAVGFIAVLSLAVLGFIYRSRLSSGFDLLVEATGSTTAAGWTLAASLLVFGWISVWMLLPILIYFELRHLGRRADEQDQIIRLCARHLARLSANCDLPRSETARDQQRSTSVASDESRVG